MVFEGNPQYGVELQPLDFALYARACGAAGFTLEDPDRAEEVLSQAFTQPGPAVVEAVVDPNEPLMPGHVTMDQAWKFAESLARGEKDRWSILKNVLKQQVREVV
jgi:pyruvate dehydrogenase (quinone)